ncbi:MAG: tryptophan--tRNA ligase [Ruminococcus sp.]|nr:tryptophan--tRNA ligase [Ruminococcus sp.]
MAENNIILTGDRPTGSLHLGHFVGSLSNRVRLQNTGKYEPFVMIADLQALTDNAENPEKIRQNILEVTLDYLAVGLDPAKTTIFVQSHIPALTELPMYYSNLVTMSRLERNPTIKSEIKMRNFERSIPVGFMTYPISQAADITAFRAKYVPVGEDQLPMLEQAREIVSSFNRIYNCEILVEPEAILPENSSCNRLVGTDGSSKMSKSLGNCVYLKDDEKTLKQKVMSMYTDPEHINVSDPGHLEGNAVFTYLDAFATDEQVNAFFPEYQTLGDMKEHYTKGGLGDMKCKKLLNSIMQDMLRPIRERREEYAKDKGELLNILRKGTDHAIEVSNETLKLVRNAIGIDYFSDKEFLEKYAK